MLVRREILPRLTYLKKEVEQLEETDMLKEELRDQYLVYLKQEALWLHAKKEEILSKKKVSESNIADLKKKIEAQESIPDVVSTQEFEKELKKT